MQSVDKMTDEGLVVAMLVKMGYRQWDSTYRPSWWVRDNGEWYDYNAAASHVFAAEVKDFMRIRGFYRRERDAIPVGLITFYNHVFSGSGHSSYENQDEYPRAVCIAALKALENENV